MQLPDENIEYNFQRLLVPTIETWTPAAELSTQHFLPVERLDALKKQITEVRGQVGAERELLNPPLRLRPLQAGFVDLPQKTLDQYKRKQDISDLGRVLRAANRLRENVDRVIVVGAGGAYRGARALFEALSHAHHNEMPAKLRMGRPRLYFAGETFDNDALQDLLELLDNTCVDPDIQAERWGAVLISRGGGPLEAAAAYRAMRSEAARFYGPKSELLRKVVAPVTGARSRLRDLAKADGYYDEDIPTLPDDVAGRFGPFTAAGLLPAAVLGLDVRAMLLGAATMTRRFLEEPFDRNPVLQFAAVNYLMASEQHKTTRVLAVWSKKLEAVGWWYDQMVSESLGKQGRGPTPLTVVFPRDLHARGQQFQDGPRDKIINNLVVRTCKHPPVMIGMADRNEDDLNAFSRKGHPDLAEAAFKGASDAFADAARPTADIVLPTVSEHTIGQLLQMLMLATVVEGRLMGVNPYGSPGVDPYRANTLRVLKATPNLPRGEVRDQAKGV